MKNLYDRIGSASCVADYRKTIRSKNYRILSAACRGTFFAFSCDKAPERNAADDRRKRKAKEKKELPGNGVEFVCLWVGTACFLFTPVSQGMKLTVLDVGQGDGIYLHTDSGYDIFIDGGSTNVQSVGKYRILPYLKSNGVNEIDYWFVSHTDLDHISGLLEIFDEGYRIRNLVLFRGMMRDESYEKLVSLAKEHGTEICMMSRKDTLFLEAQR